jgi:hypothetical protein
VSSQSRHLSVRDEVQRIAKSCVLGHGSVVPVNGSVFVVDNIFQDASEFDGVSYIGFGFFVEIDAFGVASTFYVEDSFVGSDVFVVSEHESLGIG